MLANRLWRWPNIKATLVQRLVFAGTALRGIRLKDEGKPEIYLIKKESVSEIRIDHAEGEVRPRWRGDLLSQSEWIMLDGAESKMRPRLLGHLLSHKITLMHISKTPLNTI